jgi:hypothetical protein
MNYDEYGGEDGDSICCPICDATTDEGCDHVVACIDQTFDACEGGFACEKWWDESRQRIETAFKDCVQAGREPEWQCVYVEEAWVAMIKQRLDNEEDVFVHAATATDLLIYVLEESGGTEIGVGLTGPSGGRCESEYRLVYAERPDEVCRKAAEMLTHLVAQRTA